MNINRLNKTMELLIESTIQESYEPHLTPEDVYGYINDKHSTGWEQTDYEDWDAVNKYDYYKLEDIRVDSLNIKAQRPNVAKEYSKGNSDYPPIVIDKETRDILDGNHRTLATQLRGEPTIKAYVGYNKMTDEN